MSKTKEKLKYLVGSVESAIDILNAFKENNKGSLSIAELSKRLNMGKSKVCRLISTLSYKGFIEKDKGTREYRIGLNAFEIGTIYLNNMSINKEIILYLQELVNECSESVRLAALDREKCEVIYLHKVDSLRTVRIFTTVGQRYPAHSSALGKVLLTYLSPEELDEALKNKVLEKFTKNTITSTSVLRKHLEMIMKIGYAIDNCEGYHEVRCVAAPIRNHRKEVILAVSISGLSNRITLKRIKNHLAPAVMRTAKKISERFGYIEE